MNNFPWWRKLWARFGSPAMQVKRGVRRRLRFLASSTIECRPDPVDARFGVETERIVARGRFAAVTSNCRFGTRYQATESSTVDEMIDALPIDLRRFTFVDFGSGKGRVVMIAAQRAFRRVIGVEFIPELDRIARRNLEIAAPHLAAPVECACEDAARWELPDEPLVVFMHNPFGEPVLGTVLARITAPSAHERWLITGGVDVDAERGFERIAGRGKWSVWRVRPQPSRIELEHVSATG